MKSFNEYITEVIDWDQNTLFAIGPSGKIEFHHDRKGTMIEHPDAFEYLNFMDRPSSREFNRGIKDLRDPNARGFPGADRPKAVSWGRIDHVNGVLHIVTEHGTTPYGIGRNEKDKRKRENDVFNRLHALKHLKQTHPEYQIHHGYEGGWDSPRTPRIISYSKYEKELMKHLTGD